MMNRRQWIGFVVFPAAITGLLAFLFLVGGIGIFRTLGPDAALATLKGAEKPEERFHAAHRVVQLVEKGELDREKGRAALTEALEDPSPGVRMNVAFDLHRLDGSAAAPALEGLVKDEDADVRKVACHLLGSLQAKSALPVLAGALKDEWEPVRWNAAVALARLGDGSGREVLHDMLRAPAPRTTSKAASRLLPTGETIAPEPNKDTHRSAILALDLVGDASSAAALRRFVAADIEPDLNALAEAAARDIDQRLAGE